MTPTTPTTAPHRRECRTDRATRARQRGVSQAAEAKHGGRLSTDTATDETTSDVCLTWSARPRATSLGSDAGSVSHRLKQRPEKIAYR
jgi:hypothetical protein